MCNCDAKHHCQLAAFSKQFKASVQSDQYMLVYTTDSHVTACTQYSFLDLTVSLVLQTAVPSRSVKIVECAFLDSTVSLVLQIAVPSRSVKTVECPFMDSTVSLVLQIAVPSRFVKTVECSFFGLDCVSGLGTSSAQPLCQHRRVLVTGAGNSRLAGDPHLLPRQ